MEPRAEFADYVDEAGRFVRHWTYGSGHRPLMEISTDREAFDPPFESGLMLREVSKGSGVRLRWLSEDQWRRAAALLLLGMVEIQEVSMSSRTHVIGG